MTGIQLRSRRDYKPDELPDNELTNSGDVEAVGDGNYVLVLDDCVVEFEMALECTAYYKKMKMVK